MEVKKLKKNLNLIKKTNFLYLTIDLMKNKCRRDLQFNKKRLNRQIPREELQCLTNKFKHSFKVCSVVI